MNIVPSVVAAGVAQTGLQAQQQGRMRAARSLQRHRQTRMVRETAEIHLNALDENDQGHAGVHVSITDDLPDQPSPEMPRKAKPATPHQADESADLPTQDALGQAQVTPNDVAGQSATSHDTTPPTPTRPRLDVTA